MKDFHHEGLESGCASSVGLGANVNPRCEPQCGIEQSPHGPRISTRGV